MSIKQSGPMSQIGLLEKNGVQLYQKHINPVKYYSPNKLNYVNIWTQYDLQQYCSELVWEGLPNGLTSWNLNRMLYLRGALCGFEHEKQIYILPFTYDGSLNLYGMPAKVTPIAFNGRIGSKDDQKAFGGLELPVDVNGNETDDYEAVLLYDGIPYSESTNPPSRFSLNQIIIREIADALARVNINMVVSNKKILLQVKDPKQADVVKEELAMAFGTDSPFAVISTPLEAGSVQSTSDFNCDDIFNTVKNWDAIRCFMSGIHAGHFGIDKKERVATGELVGNEEQINLVADLRLELAQLWADKMNERFGTTITVHLRADDYEEETNGNGMTKEDEEESL